MSVDAKRFEPWVDIKRELAFCPGVHASFLPEVEIEAFFSMIFGYPTILSASSSATNLRLVVLFSNGTITKLKLYMQTDNCSSSLLQIVLGVWTKMVS